MQRWKCWEVFILLAVIAFISSGCGFPDPFESISGTGPVAPPISTAQPTVPVVTALSEATGDKEADAKVVNRLQDVHTAVVRIVVEGKIVELTNEGAATRVGFGSGSGFIVDPRGLVVTNNHVVTGAGRLKVFISGEDEPRDAKVVGVSECSDLAVIDIEGDGFSYLEWYDGDITPGLPIWAAGYPDGDPEFTLTDGTVSRANAQGESSWSSVSYVMEHTAESRGGNSGGPVVTEDGKVLAVHYAGNNTTRQHFAIKRDEALEVLTHLQQGRDDASIGLNGYAVLLTQELSGVWIRSVQPGSPADRAGLRSGDMIVEMQGIRLGRAGTMTEYCDIIGNWTDETLSMKVLRFGESGVPQSILVLEGQINGTTLTQTNAIPLTTTTDATPNNASPPPPTQPPAPAPASLIQPLNVQGADLQAVQQEHSTQMQAYQQQFFEDFQRGGSASRWNQGPNEQIGLALVHNVYRITMNQASTLNWAPWQQGMYGNNYVVELAVVVGGQGGAVGAGIGFDEQGDANSASYFLVHSDATWQVVTLRNGALVPEYSTAPMTSTHIVHGANTNRLWVVRTPDCTEFWINAAPVAIGPPSVFSGGRVGVVGWSGTDITAPVAADVDDLLIWMPR